MKNRFGINVTFMKIKHSYLIIILALLFASCQSYVNYSDVVAQNDDVHRIYLYGETHGIQLIMQKEIELWEDYYTNQNFRHLFMEIGYCDAQLLNLWMESGDEDFLNVISENIASTVNNGEERAKLNKWFYNEIKSRCPETIFHGTDIQHQWKTAEWYQKYLENLNQQDSQEYKMAAKSIEACEQYYYDIDKTDDKFREEYMIERFKQEFDELSSLTKIMGIYGAQHTRFDGKSLNSDISNMATQLREYYYNREGNIIYTEDISKLKKYQRSKKES